MAVNTTPASKKKPIIALSAIPVVNISSFAVERNVIGVVYFGARLLKKFENVNSYLLISVYLFEWLKSNRIGIISIKSLES